MRNSLRTHIPVCQAQGWSRPPAPLPAGDTPPQFPGLGVAGGHLALHPHLGVCQHAGHTLQEGQVCGVQLEPTCEDRKRRILLPLPKYSNMSMAMVKVEQDDSATSGCSDSLSLELGHGFFCGCPLLP